jgi:hypothetical protein
MIKLFEKWLIFERLNSAKGRNMMKLVDYFEKSIKEKEAELPEFFQIHYPHIFDNWALENSNYFVELDEYDSEEEAYENVIYPTTYYELESDILEKYKNFLIEIVDNVFKKNPYNLDLCILPLYVTYTYEDDVIDGWLVHFTDYEKNIKSILKSQHFQGIPNMYNLAITSTNEDDYSEDGYCFGFDISDVYENFKDGYSHYGNFGILFKSSGIKLYHNGDDEHQVVFIGNQVSNLIPFWYDPNTKELYNKNKTIRSNDYEYFFEQIIES